LFHQVAQYHEAGPVIAEPLIPELEFTRGHRLGHILNIERQATYEGLHQAGASVALLELKDLSAFTLSYYYMTWQLVVGALGECLNIDAFSQPGVELAKSLAKHKLVRP
jgi:glucose-6-phosphate isomerase